MKIAFTLFIIWMSCYGVYAQDYSQKYLAALEDEGLLLLFKEVREDSIIAEKVARAYLQRGRDQNDTIKIARGYDRLARIFNPKKNISFADSIIQVMGNKNHKTYPANAYMMKGYEYNRLGDLVNSTKNFHRLYEYSLLNDNISHQLYAMSFLISSKSFWGDATEALELQIKRHRLIQGEDFEKKLIKSSRKGYSGDIRILANSIEISSIYSFIFCYINLKEYEHAKIYIDSLNLKIRNYSGDEKREYYNWLYECKLELSYYIRDYEELEKLSDLVEPKQMLSNDSAALFDNYGFRGLMNFEIGNDAEGINYLLKADSIFDNSELRILPYRRRVFKRISDYFLERQDESKQIRYLNKLIEIDSVLKVNLQYFEPENIKKFDTPLLLKEKELAIAKLETKNNRIEKNNLIAIIIISISFALVAYYFNRQLVYKRRFNDLISHGSNDTEVSIDKQHSMAPAIVEEILQKLTTFEEQHTFLKKDLYLQDLAKSFGTNSNYLSRVINLKMEKNYSQYIHHLRVGYSMDQLMTNRKFRNYTIKAIAEECGYSNAESYSRAFYKINGIYPSYFIKKINQKKV